MRDLSSYLLISFSSLLTSSFENVYGLIWASYSSHKICMKGENNRKETIQVFDDQNKILVGLKSSLLKNSYQKIGKEIKDHMHPFVPILALF